MPRVRSSGDRFKGKFMGAPILALEFIKVAVPKESQRPQISK